jgi:hypothetical protein
MKNLFIWALFGGIILGCICCKSSPTKNEDAPTETETNAPQKSTPVGEDPKESVLKVVDSKELTELLSKYKHIDNYLRVMDDDRERLFHLEKLRTRPGLLDEALELYNKLTEISNEDNHYLFHEARWRIVHLIGDIEDPKVSSKLYDIAVSALPNPENVKESTYESEYRIRLRAIAGIEKSKGVDFLQNIHQQNTLLSGAAAAGLFELGVAPAGVKKLDEKKVIGLGDPQDFKVNAQNIIERGYERTPTIKTENDTTTTIVPKPKKNNNEK